MYTHHLHIMYILHVHIHTVHIHYPDTSFTHCVHYVYTCCTHMYVCQSCTRFMDTFHAHVFMYTHHALTAHTHTIHLLHVLMSCAHFMHTYYVSGCRQGSAPIRGEQTYIYFPFSDPAEASS